MRVSVSVLRWLSAGICALVVLLLATVPAAADTGTYRITNYMVTLQPQSDGQVRITIVQDWRVLGGHIPWVTVGLPNKNFSVASFSSAASNVAAANDSGFTGVRVDLTKDYQPGQDFEIEFVVLQKNLLERLTAEKQWRIDYTPGWYDNAYIDHLEVTLLSPVDFQTYSSVSPLPSASNSNVIDWEATNLSPGSRFNISVASDDGSFLAASVPVGKAKSGGLGKSFYITIAVIVAVGLLIFWAIRKSRQTRDAELRSRATAIQSEMEKDAGKKKEVEEGFEQYVEKKNIQPDAQGRYYDRSYGDYITPALWAAIIANQVRQQQAFTSGASFRSGCVSCACVSCACACACDCAGGGAAGCARKTLHECHSCSVLKEKATG